MVVGEWIIVYLFKEREREKSMKSNNKIAQSEIKQPRRSFPIWLQLLMYANIFIYIYDGFFDVPQRKLLGLAISGLLATLTFWVYRDHIVWVDVLIPLFFFLILIYARSYSFRGYTSFIKNVPYSLIGFSIAVLLKYAYWPKWSFYSYFLIASMPFVYGFFIMKIDMNNFVGVLQMNRNSIPLLLVLTGSLLYMVEHSQNKAWLSVFPGFVILLFSFLSKSRTGLLMALALFLLIWTVNLSYIVKPAIQKAKHDKKYRYTCIAIVVVSIVVIGGIMGFMFMNSRFATEGFHTSSRVEMILEYFSELTFKGFLFGFRPEVINLFSRIDNSYIMVLCYIGIGAFIFYWLLGYSLIIFIKQRSLLMFGLLAIQMVYGLAEFLSPLDIGDIVLIPILVLAFSFPKKDSWYTRKTPASRLWPKDIKELQ